MDRTWDLLVVGAGAIGLACGWRAAQRGASVLVLERARPGAGASTAAAGLISPSDPHEWEGALGAVNLAAMAGWEAFAAELAAASGADVGYARSGSLRVARSDDETGPLGIAERALAAAGLPFERLDTDGCAALEPGLRGVAAGLHAPADAHVDTGLLVAALLRAAEAAGVEVEGGAEPVDAVWGAAGALEGLVLADGTRRAAALTVLATGAWSAHTRWLAPDLRPDVRPVAGEYVLLRGDPEAPACRRVVRPPSGSIVPRAEGRHWVGTTVRDAGFLALPVAREVRGVLERAAAVLPAVGDLGIEAVGVGLRPVSGDGLPLVGPTAVPGLAFATGHGRAGILQVPPTADAIAALATGAAPPPELAAFAPGR